MLDNLRNIDGERDVSDPRKSTGLELYDLVEDSVVNHTDELWITNDIYPEGLNSHLRKRVPEFTSTDLDSFIRIVMNRENGEVGDRALAAASGTFLTILAERNRERGISEEFYFNGMGQTFDYLFERASGVDSLIIDDFQGDFICADLCYSAPVGDILIANCRGTAPAFCAGRMKDMRSIFAVNHDGYSTRDILFHEIMHCIGTEKFRVNAAACVNCSSDMMLVEGDINEQRSCDISAIINSTAKCCLYQIGALDCQVPSRLVNKVAVYLPDSYHELKIKKDPLPAGAKPKDFKYFADAMKGADGRRIADLCHELRYMLKMMYHDFAKEHPPPQVIE